MCFKLPELPEVEVIVRDLKVNVVGQRISHIEIFTPRLLQGISAQEFSASISGETVRSVDRKGKYILFYFNSMVLEVHLRMTGRFFFSLPQRPIDKFTRAVFHLHGEKKLEYHDIRKLGTFKLFRKEDIIKAPSFQLGIDPLAGNFSLTTFESIMREKPASRIKSFLLNQKNIAGLGNIYTDETLYRAKIHPMTRVGHLGKDEIQILYNSLRDVLSEALKFRGTSFSDYRDLWGKRGEFQDFLRIYRRSGETCPECGQVIMRQVIAGRGTCFCPGCQRQK